MKKYFLLITTFTLLLTAFGQQINKKLIYGHWIAYSVKMNDFAFNTDSLKQTQQTMVKAALSLAPGHTLGEEDSLKIIENALMISKKIDSSYAEFTKKGTYSSFAGFTKGDEKDRNKAGTFVWIGDDKISLNHNGTAEIIAVKYLTPQNMVVVGNEETPKEKYQIEFRKK